MKSLTTIVNENILSDVLENFGSEKLGKAFSNLKAKFKDTMRILSWDKLTDDDFEILSCEEARKLAYKRDSSEVIVWFDGAPGNEITDNDYPVCITTGNYMIQFMNYSVAGKFGTGRSGRNHTVKNISDYSAKAVHILDPDKFLTRELRRARSEAKENASALKSEEEIAEENQKRYRSLLAKKRLDRDANQAAVDARIESVAAEYAAIIQELTGDGNITSDTIFAIKTLNNDFRKIMDEYETVIKYSLEGEPDNFDANYAKQALAYTEKETIKLKEHINMFKKDLKTAKRNIISSSYASAL